MFVGYMHNFILYKKWPQTLWLHLERCVHKDPACARKIHTLPVFQYPHKK